MAMGDIKLGVTERRRYSRTRIVGLAKITLPGQYFDMRCVVLDLSHAGARIQPEDAQDCPDNFTLVFKGGCSKECQVVWRRDDNIGVRFI